MYVCIRDILHHNWYGCSMHVPKTQAHIWLIYILLLSLYVHEKVCARVRVRSRHMSTNSQVLASCDSCSCRSDGSPGMRRDRHPYERVNLSFFFFFTLFTRPAGDSRTNRSGENLSITWHAVQGDHAIRGLHKVKNAERVLDHVNSYETEASWLSAKAHASDLHVGYWH